MRETTGPKLAELEALLFYYGEPLSVKKISKMLDLKERNCEELIAQFETVLKEDERRGLILVRNEREIQLVTKPAHQRIGQRLIREEFKEELTPAGLDVLSIVAYLGPVSRATIDYTRGVNSSFTLRNLLMRGLVERELAPEKGNAFIYRVSFAFLKHLGLSRGEELPDYEKYKDVLNRFELEKPREQGEESAKTRAPSQET